MPENPFLRSVHVRNYKSLGRCEVKLGGLTLLVGRNGSGKSNLLDALRFVVEGLQTSLDHALKSRGGVNEVRRRSTGHPHNFAIRLELDLPNWRRATYGFEIGGKRKGGFFIKHERLEIRAGGEVEAFFEVSEGELVRSSVDKAPPAVQDRLFLVTAAGLPTFRPVYDALLAMAFYNLNPQQMKEVQSPDAGELLRRDGSNIASVVGRLTDDRPEVKQRIGEYLRVIVPDVVEFGRVPLGHRETLEFRQEVRGAEHPWRFYAGSMSDGTLRCLGILVAALQLVQHAEPVRLVGIEEPETALHPAAAGALMDALREAATHTQIVITSHSPDLLDQFRPETDCLLVVQSNQGTTDIAPADPASLEAIRGHLYSAGDLLRMDQLQPDPAAIEGQAELVFE